MYMYDNLKTFTTESLKTDSLKLLSAFSSGNLFNTLFEFRGHIPVALNPAIKFAGFNLCINFHSIEGNASLEDCLFSLTRVSKCLSCLSTLFLQNEKQQHQEAGIINE